MISNYFQGFQKNPRVVCKFNGTNFGNNFYKIKINTVFSGNKCKQPNHLMTYNNNFYSEFGEGVIDRYQQYQLDNEVGVSLSAETRDKSIDISLHSKTGKEISTVSIDLDDFYDDNLLLKDDIYFFNNSLVIENR